MVFVKKNLLTAAARKMPVRNVCVTVVGSDIAAETDRDGKFSLELAPGDYQLRIEHPDYQSRLLSNLRVLAKMQLIIAVDMPAAEQGIDNTVSTAGALLEEVAVIARYRPRNPIVMERMSAAVVDNIDFAQIARFDDSTVSAAIKRGV